jgi:uncharacterized protein (DUF1697 family)
MTTYIAFLRGIGGLDTKIKMQVLKEAFEGMGFQNVRTVIASGNVLFDTEPAREGDLERSIEQALPNAIGFGADTFVLTLDKLQRLARSSLVKEMAANPKMRHFVTFLKKAPKSRVTFSGKGFQLLGRSGRALLSFIDPAIAPAADLMNLIEKQFGKPTTTRSWKTIERILKERG